MTDKTYNGWTNYETWRVNLEVFDGFDPTEYYSACDLTDAYELGQSLKQYAEEVIFECGYDERKQSSLIEDYARAFLENVNWFEIAKHLIADYAENEVTE
jgi:hypothetical protein